MATETEKLCVLRELALALHSFDRARSEASLMLVGRAFTPGELGRTFALLRAIDPRAVDHVTLTNFIRELDK